MLDNAVKALLEVTEATLPVLALIFFFQIVILRKRPTQLRRKFLGIGMAMLGFFLFILGAKMSLIPMGSQIGERLVNMPIALVLLFVFALGIAVAFAEPAMRILAYEVDDVSSGSLNERLVSRTIALGVGLALVISVLRTWYAIPLSYVLLLGYGIIIALTLWAPKRFTAVAYDAGAVATGPVVVNFLLPLSTGIAEGIWAEEAGSLGFGLVGIIAIFPIVAMLLLSVALKKGLNHA